MRSFSRLVVPSLFVIAVIACSSSSSTTASPPNDAGAGDASTPPAPPADAAAPTAVDAQLTGCTRDPGPTPPTFDPNAVSDPTGGAAKFTIDEALAGFPSGGGGKLVALISTEEGFIRCELAESVAPISVANFVGLARGTRPYIGDGKWKVGRFYDGLVWHRVIPDFVIQGGDPDGVGSGGPGYDLVDENHVDEPTGTLAMAASTAPSGSQFYVVVGKGPAANYNVFGTCTTDAAIKIANVPRDANDKPTTDVHMQRIDIARCP